MLTIDQLEKFAANCVTELENLQDYTLVASDDEISKEIKQMVHPKDNCTLVAVLPDHDVSIPNEDNRKMRNNLILMVIKKTDNKAGKDTRIHNFKIAQSIILKITKKIVQLHHNSGLDCIFKEIDLNSITINPIQNYHQTNGYSIEFTTKTTF